MSIASPEKGIRREAGASRQPASPKTCRKPRPIGLGKYTRLRGEGRVMRVVVFLQKTPFSGTKPPRRKFCFTLSLERTIPRWPQFNRLSPISIQISPRRSRAADAGPQAQRRARTRRRQQDRPRRRALLPRPAARRRHPRRQQDHRRPLRRRHTRELDSISIQTAASLIAEEPEYSRLAARLLLATIAKEVAGQNIYSFSQSIEIGNREGVVSADAAAFVAANARKLNSRHRRPLLRPLRILRPAHRLRPLPAAPSHHPPGHRDAAILLHARCCGLSTRVNEAIDFYNLLASHDYLPSSPTLFNSGTKHSADVSCYLHRFAARFARLHLRRLQAVALLSKFSGGIGLAFHRIRSAKAR
jgi:hypothetical protein